MVENNIDSQSEKEQQASETLPVAIKSKPLSDNRFKAFFQRIYRWWLGRWYEYADAHRKAADLIYTVFFFFVFSVGVTIYQYLVMTFLPYAFASLNDGAWGWPNIPIAAAGGEAYVLFGDANGLGYFIAFEIATFTAQCINFPLQRNVTYRSHGKVVWQAFWYFIAWALISVFTLSLWGIINCFVIYLGWPEAVTGLLKTIVTGLISMVIFFFIFMITFPNREKTAKKLLKRLNRLEEKSADERKISALRSRYEKAKYDADLDRLTRNFESASASADAKAVVYESAVKKVESIKRGEGKADEDLAAAESYRDKAYESAVAALEKSVDAEKALREFNETNGKVIASRD